MSARVAGAARRSARAGTPRLTIVPVTAERWDDLEALFGPRGACAGCWCMWPRLRGGAYRDGMGEPHHRALRALVRGGDEPGLIAYAGSEPVAWCALAPRDQYPRIIHSRLFRAETPDPAVWAVPCFFIARAARGRGVTRALLEAAVRHARSRGARAVEGYPFEPRSGRTADAFMWTGIASTFRGVGFSEVARPSPTRPLMRIELGRARRAATPAPTDSAPSRAAKPAARTRTPKPAARIRTPRRG